jgi:hypothetical protein
VAPPGPLKTLAQAKMWSLEPVRVMVPVAAQLPPVAVVLVL